MSKKTSSKNGSNNAAEQVMLDAGKSVEEVKSTGAVDRADAATDSLYDDRKGNSGSPSHRAIWKGIGLHHFLPDNDVVDPRVEEVIANTLASLRANKAAGTAYDERGKISQKSYQDLAAAGYFGLQVDKEYGGSGASFKRFARMMTELAAAGFETEAGVASVHGCIGAVKPLSKFGSDEQKAKYLPGLASGERISFFALTEPNAGSDLTNLRTTAFRDGDDYVIVGEKLFISNATYGRTGCLVSMVEGEDKPAVFVIELPKTDTETFELVSYGLHPLRKTINHGLRFKKFRIPAANRLPGDNGLVPAYYGLNYGRVAIAALAAGAMRYQLRSITPGAWGQYRETFTKPIETRSNVKHRIARLAGMILAADAQRDWCASKLDDGYRGELECIVAKVAGSFMQKEATIDLTMITHGGRSMLHGHFIGDNVHETLAALIYEGEGAMLSMKYFLSLAMEHGEKFMLPLGESLKSFKKGRIFAGLGGLIGNGVPFAAWLAKTYLRRFTAGSYISGDFAKMDSRLKKHCKFAQKMCSKLALEMTYYMVKHQAKLADRQPRIVNMSFRVQDTLTMLVTAMHAHKLGDAASIAAADILCQDLRRKLTGEMPSDDYFAACDKLADKVIAGEFKQIDCAAETAIVRPYAKNASEGNGGGLNLKC